jgi:hypothetical protein
MSIKSLERTRYSGLFLRSVRIIASEKPAVTRRSIQRYVLRTDSDYTGLIRRIAWNRS